MTRPAPKSVVVTGAFDDLRSRHLRFLEEAAKLGPLTVFLWGDELLRRQTGGAPKFPQAEREYVLKAVRFVSQVRLLETAVGPDALPDVAELGPACWVVAAAEGNPARESFCRAHGLDYRVLSDEDTRGFPEIPAAPARETRKKVIVTGCYDWLHSGHIRFFEEVSRHGDVYVVVGHDANVRLLKGPSHPLHAEDERRYMAGSIRFVTQALVSTGHGWLDAEPEIDRLRPDIYAVNEDGDQGGKREFCAGRGMEYLVLKRTPAPGLPRRTSTDLRGF